MDEPAITTIVAMDNLTLSTEKSVDPSYLLHVADVMNAEAERVKPQVAKTLSDLLVYGRCKIQVGE